MTHGQRSGAASLLRRQVGGAANLEAFTIPLRGDIAPYPSRQLRDALPSTQVGIVGAGGLLLSHLLALRGIDSIVVENRSRAYCEARQRAGLLEAGTVELLRTVGLGERMDAEGLEHGGIYLQFEGERHHLDFRDLTGGRWVTIYAQTEIVKDLIRARLAAGAMIEFEVSGHRGRRARYRPAGAPLHRRRGHQARSHLRRHRRL